MPVLIRFEPLLPDCDTSNRKKTMFYPCTLFYRYGRPIPISLRFVALYYSFLSFPFMTVGGPVVTFVVEIPTIRIIFDQMHTYETQVGGLQSQLLKIPTTLQQHQWTDPWLMQICRRRNYDTTERRHFKPQLVSPKSALLLHDCPSNSGLSQNVWSYDYFSIITPLVHPMH